ncbi:MAG: hypothetical protein NT007_04160 [Candidatus Kapabacteria bacterium]|nr:hypothetical protein [Candidatus Kapabacteria bacterium]
MKLFHEIIRKKAKPRTYFDELAQLGLLDEYLKKFLKDDYKSDEIFKDEIFETLILNSREVVPEIEIFFLEQLCKTLSYFLEYTKQWRIQEP